MSSGWEWAQAVLERAVAPLPGGYRIEKVADDPAYWAAWEAAFALLHDADELAAYEFRNGLATLTPELLKHRCGAPIKPGTRRFDHRACTRTAGADLWARSKPGPQDQEV